MHLRIWLVHSMTICFTTTVRRKHGVYAPRWEYLREICTVTTHLAFDALPERLEGWADCRVGHHLRKLCNLHMAGSLYGLSQVTNFMTRQWSKDALDHSNVHVSSMWGLLQWTELSAHSYVFGTRVHSTTSSFISRDGSITFENKESFMPSSLLWKSRSNGSRLTDLIQFIAIGRKTKMIVTHMQLLPWRMFSPEVTVL